MRWLIALILILPTTAVVTGACGSARQPTRGFVNTPSEDSYREGDDDDDDREKPRSDPDDASVRDYGHPVDAMEKRAIVRLVGRYYAAAAADDGPLACSLIYPPFTRGSGIIDALPSNYVPAPGSTVLRGESCAQVATLLFKLNRQQILEESRGVRVVEARVSATRGYVVLRFKVMPERWLTIERENAGDWRIAAFVDSKMR
jgi:hypothetical protein